MVHLVLLIFYYFLFNNIIALIFYGFLIN